MSGITVFLGISNAIVDLLNAGTPVCGAIYQARDRAIAENNDQAINVQFDGALPDVPSINGAPVDWTSTLTVECYAKSKSQGGDKAVDPLLLAVYERIAGSNNLDRLVDDIRVPLIEAIYDEGSIKTGWVRMTYRMVHRTQHNQIGHP